MDEYRHLYRAPVSAGLYPSSRYPAYSVADPLYSTYSLVPLDAYAGYGAPAVSYQPEFIPLPRYSVPIHSSSPRRRTNPKRRPPPVQSLAPNRKPFKKTQKNLPVENLTRQKGSQKKAPQRKPMHNEQKGATSTGKKQNSSAATLAKETQELHSLFRTGVDPSSGKKLVKPSAKKADGTPGKNNSPTVTGQKRKTDSQEKDEVPSRAKRTRERGKNKKLGKEKKQGAQIDKKPVASTTPKTVKASPPVLTEEEKKEIEVLLELQIATCKDVAEFLGVPEKREELEKSEGAEVSADEAKLDGAQATSGEAQAKSHEAPKPAPMTTEEEKELEEKGYNFFSKLLEDNQDLRKLYIDKKDSGTFECLVCHSVNPETSKTFANLFSLVMHTSMRKQKQYEHRGYGRAICDVLGWEPLRAKRPAKQTKEDDLAKQPEAQKVLEEGEGKPEGSLKVLSDEQNADS